jgi:hypothetical protein
MKTKAERQLRRVLVETQTRRKHTTKMTRQEMLHVIDIVESNKGSISAPDRRFLMNGH